MFQHTSVYTHTRARARTYTHTHHRVLCQPRLQTRSMPTSPVQDSPPAEHAASERRFSPSHQAPYTVSLPCVRTSWARQDGEKANTPVCPCEGPEAMPGRSWGAFQNASHTWLRSNQGMEPTWFLSTLLPCCVTGNKPLVLTDWQLLPPLR